jgi:hypothetical protein
MQAELQHRQAGLRGDGRATVIVYGESVGARELFESDCSAISDWPDRRPIAAPKTGSRATDAAKGFRQFVGRAGQARSCLCFEKVGSQQIL